MAEPPMPEIPDYYSDLGLEISACERDIRVAYLRLAQQHHPDKRLGGSAGSFDAVEFRKVNEAYCFLRDERQRKRYDETYLGSVVTEWASYRVKHEAWVKKREALAKAKKLMDEVVEEKKKAAAEAKAKKAEEAVEKKKKAELAKERKKFEAEQKRKEREDRVRRFREERERQDAAEAAHQAKKAEEHMSEQEEETPKTRERQDSVNADADKDRLEEKARQAEERSRQAAERARQAQAEAAQERLRSQHTESSTSDPPRSPKRSFDDTSRDEPTPQSDRREKAPKTEEGESFTLSKTVKLIIAKEWAKNKHKAYLKKNSLKGNESIVADTYIELDWTKETAVKKCDDCSRKCKHFQYRCPNGGLIVCPPCKAKFSCYGF